MTEIKLDVKDIVLGSRNKKMDYLLDNPLVKDFLNLIRIIIKNRKN